MAAEIPTKEPLEIRAGDTVKWKKTVDDYRASDGWTLKYSLRGNSTTIDLTSTASGDEHLISETPSTSAAWAAGHYDVVGYVEKTGERHTVYESRIEVLPDLVAAGDSYDGRTHVKKTLDNIESVLENRASKEVEESTIEGVMIKRIPHDTLLMMRSKYLNWYQQEQAAERIKIGLGSSNHILTRFS